MTGKSMISAFADFTNAVLPIYRRRGRSQRPSKKQPVGMESTSGPTCTHACLANGCFNRRGRLAHRDKFLCKDAVDPVKLLYLARRELYSKAQSCGGNVLIDEQWSCKIKQPRHHKKNRFRVSIDYSAVVARSSWPDAQRPVELQSAKGVDGLMTILDRD